MGISDSNTTNDFSGDGVLQSLADKHENEAIALIDLADWLSSGECPQDAIRAAAASALQLTTGSTDTVKRMADELMPQLEGTARDTGDSDSRRLEVENILADYFNRETILSTNTIGVAADIILDATADAVIVTYGGHHSPSSEEGPLSDNAPESSVQITVRDLVKLWNDTPEVERPAGGFPLDILYIAWLNRPQPVEASLREKGRILPAKLAQVAPGDRRAGKLFATAAHVARDIEASQLSFAGFQQMGTSAQNPPRNTSDQQSILPGFQDPETIGPCLPLALYDLGDAPSTSRGPAAPLALRLFVESVLAVPMESRDIESPVAMTVTLRQMLEWLYPGKRKPRPNEYWPRLMAAFDALESPAARVPLYNPETRQGEMRRIVSISGIPRGPSQLDDWIRIIVDLPAGSGNGPQVSDNLRHWGVQSAAAYRALLNLAYQWFEPGRTHFPVGRGKRRFWAQVNDAKRYPALTDDELIALCFPTSQHSQHWRLKQKGLAVIRQLEKAGELRIVDGHILPPAPVG